MMVVWRAGAALMLSAWLTGRGRMHGKRYRGSTKKGERAQEKQKAPDGLSHCAQGKDGRWRGQAMFHRDTVTGKRART
ncbi:MAG: hypothetical protein M3Y22_06050, partial [Pseudomonadota bacterium]|nr:hypothetical protein [Pseudomonadota bacterium]